MAADGDPIAAANATLDDVRRQLREVARAIDPFPAFPGAMFAYGIEVPPPPGASSEAGCVILGNDGALYELRIGLDAGQVALGADHVGARHEELVLFEAPPAVYAAYARAALGAAHAYLEAGPR